MKVTRNYTGTEQSNLTAVQLSTIFSTQLWSTTVTVEFNHIQNCQISRDPNGVDWNLIWNAGVTRDPKAYISIKFENANEECAKSCRGYFTSGWTDYNHYASIAGNKIVFGDDCYYGSYGGCILGITNIEYYTVENQDVLWQDFTQTNLKNWATNEGISSDTTLNAAQKSSLEAAIGCSINGTVVYKAGNAPYLSGSLTFVFPNAVKTKAKQNDDTVVTGISFAVTASNVKEINHGDIILNGAYLWENYHNMNTYINKTDTNITGSTETNYTLQYDNTYLTKLARYGGNNKQLEFLTNAKNAINTANKEVPGFYYFNQSQNYGGGSSDKYEYWATKGNSNVQVVFNNTGYPNIQVLNDTDFTINNVLYHKKPGGEIYIIRRTGARPTVTGNFYGYFEGEDWGGTSGSGGAFHFTSAWNTIRLQTETWWTCYPTLIQTNNATLTLNYSGSKLQYMKFGDSSYIDLPTDNIFGTIIEDTVTIPDTYAPSISCVTSLSNTGVSDYVWINGQKTYYDIKYGNTGYYDEIVFGPWEKGVASPNNYYLSEYYYKYTTSSYWTKINGTLKLKTLKIGNQKLWGTPSITRVNTSWNQYKWYTDSHYYWKSIYLRLTAIIDFNIPGCIVASTSTSEKEHLNIVHRSDGTGIDSIRYYGSIQCSAYTNNSETAYAVLIYNQD